MREAFNTWRRVAPLEFIEKEQRGRESVDIDIMFGGRQHGDQYPFDGRGQAQFFRRTVPSLLFLSYKYYIIICQNCTPHIAVPPSLVQGDEPP